MADLSQTAVQAVQHAANSQPDAAVALVGILPVAERRRFRDTVRLLAEVLDPLTRCPADGRYVPSDDPQLARVGHPGHAQRWHRDCFSAAERMAVADGLDPDDPAPSRCRP